MILRHAHAARHVVTSSVQSVLLAAGCASAFFVASCGQESSLTKPPATIASDKVTTSGLWAARHGMSSANYQNQFTALASTGYALRSISGYGGNGRELYAGIWEKGSMCSAWQARHGLSSDQYQAAFNQLVGSGYRLDDVSVYEGEDGTERYAALWTTCAGPAWRAHHGMTSAQYQATFNQLAATGYRLVNVAAASIRGRTVFAGIWEQAQDQGPYQAFHGLSSAGYQQTFNSLVSQGYAPTDIAVYSENSQARYAAIFEQGATSPWVTHHGMSSTDYQQRFNSYVQQGYRLSHVEGALVGGKEIYAAIWSR